MKYRKQFRVVRVSRLCFVILALFWAFFIFVLKKINGHGSFLPQMFGAFGMWSAQTSVKPLTLHGRFTHHKNIRFFSLFPFLF